MGFPTANLTIKPGLASPPDGIYATITYLHDKAIPSVTNIGFRPTFDGKERLIETHLINFSDNLLRKKLRIDFVDKLRDEKHFNSIEELKEQMGKDVELAKTRLTKLVKK